MTAVAASGPAQEPVGAEAVPTHVLRRGLRVLIRFVRLNPLPFSIAIVGAVVYAGSSVLGTLVLGRVTDEVLTPAFKAGGADRATTWTWVALIVGVAVLRGIGTVTRRYFAGKTTWLGQAWLRREIADHFLAVPLGFHRTTSTGELLAHADADVLAATEAVNPLPFSTGLVVLVIFSVIALVAVDPVLALVALVLFPTMAVLNRYYTRRVERPAAAVQQHVGEVSGSRTRASTARSWSRPSASSTTRWIGCRSRPTRFVSSASRSAGSVPSSSRRSTRSRTWGSSRSSQSGAGASPRA